MNRKLKETLVGWGYILPSSLILLLFILIPIVMSVMFSFTDFNGITQFQWVGFKNYITMIQDKYVQISIQNTIMYTLITVPVQTILAMVLAALLASYFRNKFGETIKGTLFVPVISSAVLVGTLWTLILATDNGLLNDFLSLFGIPRINWLGDRSTALLSVCLVSIWKNVGYFLVIYYAGIMDVPVSCYESAKVDGANARQQFFYITLPSLKPITYLVVTLGVIWSFQVFDMVYAMTKGGPGSATTTLVYTIYTAAFREYRMGYASSIAVFLFMLILLFNYVQKHFFKES